MADRDDSLRVRAFTRRSLMMASGQAALMSVLVGRLYYLQVVQSEEYTMMADENRMNIRLLPPRRGRIMDRFGVEVAANRQNYRVVLIPEQTNSVEDTLDKLSKLVLVSPSDRARVLKDAKRRRGFFPIPITENLTWDEFARVNVHSPELAGVHLDVGETRHYPFDDLFAHTVGYVGAVSERDLQRLDPDPLLELPGFRIGKSGIEKYYDLALRGSAGTSRVEANAFGRVIRELSRNEGEPGNDLVLTIDAELQKFTANRLNGQSAAAAVLDIHTGDILAMVSVPAFDANAFNTGISNAEWSRLVNNTIRPLSDKAVTGQFPPGSTFKMVVALAALEAGVVSSAHQVYCSGYTTLGKHRFHCWKRGGHGRMNMEQAIEQSCDIYFYDIARKVGVDRISEMGHRLGLGELTGVDLLGEKPGLLPTKAWHQAVRGKPWPAGHTYNAGIGQGFVLATPLQLAVMTARLANGGNFVTPRLVKNAGIVEGRAVQENPAPVSLGLKESALRVVLSGMNRVVNSKKGTARGSRLKPEQGKMAGKSGTAQVRRISRKERLAGIRKSSEKLWEERDHALFVAYAPIDEPRYAISVVVEHGGGGSSVAAPVARDVLSETLRLDPVRSPGRGKFARKGGGHERA